jgi:hypothetical protein
VIVNLDCVVGTIRSEVNGHLTIITNVPGVSFEINDLNDQRSFLSALSDRWAVLDRIAEDAR